MTDTSDFFNRHQDWLCRLEKARADGTTSKIKRIKIVMELDEGLDHALGIDLTTWPKGFSEAVNILSDCAKNAAARIEAGPEPRVHD